MSSLTRREFTKLSLSALPAAAFLSATGRLSAAEAAAKPNSKVNGVQIGMNVPYSFGSKVMNEDEILTSCVQLGLSGVELRAQPVEAFLGLPPLQSAKNKEEAAQQVRDWRKTVSMDKVK